ncbi:MAG: alpha/beta hydrolase-fold protein [Bacteroidota bacterium]
MQKSPAIALFLFIIVHSATSQTGPAFNSFLHRIESEDTSRRAAIADSFMTARRPKGFPIAEDSMAFFIYRGKVDSIITVTGDYTQWSANGDPMTNISATNLYYVGKKFEPDARIDYKFIKDGNWMLDTLNPHIIKGGFGQNSELAMPSYVQPVEIQYNPAIPHGTISSFIFTSVFTGDSRTIMVYLPPRYTSTSLRYPALYVHDGADYLSLASMANVLDNMIAAKKIRPIIGIFVPPGRDRAGEYRLGKIARFTNFMVKELVPYIDSAYRTDTRGSQRGTMGSSDGGHIALYLAIHYPGTFGLAGGQSSTITDLLCAPIQNGPKIHAKFYLDVGTYDLSSTSYVFLDLNRMFRDLLIAKGYDVTYAEYHEGHSWGNWRAHTRDILKALFPYAATRTKTRERVQKNILTK